LWQQEFRRGKLALELWLLYLAAAIGLSLTPGPNGLLALTHGAIYGTKRTVNTILGGMVGFGVVIALSMFGIGALLAAASELLIVLKILGGAYLVWLGVQVWRSPAIGATSSVGALTNWAMLRAGTLSALSNPKGILFFVAFLPQFITPGSSLLLQFVIMAGTFLVVEFIYELTVASLAHRVQPFLAKFGKRVNRVFGSLFMAIGVALPLRG
jgi:threonine/homoserine/homoserine lactone efflux protein